MKPRIIKNQYYQHGSSLIETMVSLFVLAIGLLGTLALQTKSVQHNQNSYSYTQSIVLAVDLTERLRTASNIDNVKENWQTSLPSVHLPSGSVDLSETGAGVQTIKLSFSEKNSSEPKRTITFKTWY